METLVRKPSLDECKHCRELDDKARGNHSNSKPSPILIGCGNMRPLTEASKIQKGTKRWRRRLHENVVSINAIRARCFAVSEANRENKDAGYSFQGAHYPCQEARIKIEDRLRRP